MDAVSIDQRIHRLRYTNPYVDRCFRLYDIGECTYREALELAVICLAENNDELVKQYTNSLRLHPIVRVKLE